MKTLRFAFAIFMAACAMVVSAQGKPDWVNGHFTDLPHSYIKKAAGTGYTESQAREAALQEVLGNRAIEAGQRVEVMVHPSGEIVTKGGGDLTVKARVIDEYVEYLPNGSYRVTLLSQVAKNPTFDFEQVKVTNRYRFAPDVFIPGMAQMRKGSTAKGALFITGEALMIGGIIATECMRSSYVTKMNGTHDPNLIRTYSDNADNCATARNIAIAGAGAIYLWNILDGIFAKGKKHVEVSGGRSFTYTPMVGADSFGIYMALTF